MIRSGWSGSRSRRSRSATAAAAALAAGEVTVEGNRFYRDGEPWVAEGVTLVGLVSPGGAVERQAGLRRGAGGGSAPACSTRSGDYGADIVRFQVSQARARPEVAGPRPRLSRRGARRRSR